MASVDAAPLTIRTRLPERYVGLVAMLLAVSGYSFLPVFTAKLLDLGVQPADIALWRYVLTVPVFWVLAWFTARRSRAQGRLPAPPLPRVRLMLIGILLAVAALCAFFGLQRIPAGTYVVIFYTYPAFTALLSMVLGDRLSSWGWAALCLTLVGVVLTVPDFSEGLSGGNFIGVMIALINALVVAVYYILNARILKNNPALVRAAALTTTGALLSLMVVGLIMGARVPSQPEAWFYLIAMTFVSTVLPIFMINVALRRLGAARAAILGSVEPLLTALIAMVFLGQVMAPIQWAGGLVIVASVVMLQTLGSRRSNTSDLLEA
ncbi:MAG: DMT family transporter [Anaerolineae bacterium]